MSFLKRGNYASCHCLQSLNQGHAPQAPTLAALLGQWATAPVWKAPVLVAEMQQRVASIMSMTGRRFPGSESHWGHEQEEDMCSRNSCHCWKQHKMYVEKSLGSWIISSKLSFQKVKAVNGVEINLYFPIWNNNRVTLYRLWLWNLLQVFA